MSTGPTLLPPRRDLAARNVLLGQDHLGELVAKVSDFGLSRDLQGVDYIHSRTRKTKLPFRIMAPESYTRAVFNHKTDVWSFGVLVWETWSFGATPYAGLTTMREMVEFLDAGNRLQRPENCPSELYKLMSLCWKSAPEDRPTFAGIVSILDELANAPSADTDGFAATEPLTALLRRNGTSRRRDSASAASNHSYRELQSNLSDASDLARAAVEAFTPDDLRAATGGGSIGRSFERRSGAVASRANEYTPGTLRESKRQKRPELSAATAMAVLREYDQAEITVVEDTGAGPSTAVGGASTEQLV